MTVFACPDSGFGIPFLLYCCGISRVSSVPHVQGRLIFRFVAPGCPQHHTNVSVQKPTAAFSCVTKVARSLSPDLFRTQSIRRLV